MASPLSLPCRSTLVTPPSRAAVQASSLGSMPPPALAGGAMRRCAQHGALAVEHARHVGEEHELVRRERGRDGGCAVVGVHVEDGPSASRPSGATTGTRPAASAARISSVRPRRARPRSPSACTRRTSTVPSPRATVSHAHGLERGTELARDGREPRARMPASARRSTRRPPTKLHSTPRARASALICAPPPCTTQTRAVARQLRDDRPHASPFVAADLTTTVRVTSCTPR